MDELPNSKYKKGMAEEHPKIHGDGGGISMVSEDILQSILSRLPAVSFASAACVSRTWNRVCNRVLSRPKLASALSLNPSIRDAVKEVIDKVLSEPIRPHFAIACIGFKLSLHLVHDLITKSLGSKTPIVTSVASGIIGTDAVSNELKEVKWTNDSDHEEHNSPHRFRRAITLIIGFVPGLKVNAFPLFSQSEDPFISTIDKFVMDIKDYTTSVSGISSPEAIIVFGDQDTDMRPVISKLDYATSPETAIVGGECECSLYKITDPSKFITLKGPVNYFAIALVFARDREKPEGLGETRFHVMLSNGLSPIGSLYKAVSVKEKGTKTEANTWLTAKEEGQHEILNGDNLLEELDVLLGNDADTSVYIAIGVTKRRNISLGLEKPIDKLEKILGEDVLPFTIT